MAKNDNPQVIRFLESMKIKGAEEISVKFTETHPLSKSATFDKKIEYKKRKRNEYPISAISFTVTNSLLSMNVIT